jgi:hypothetical protein
MFSPQKIWLAYAEPKCKLFAWLALHGKILMADMLAIREWPHGPICQICMHALETACHVCKECPFTAAIWKKVQEGKTTPMTSRL